MSAKPLLVAYLLLILAVTLLGGWAIARAKQSTLLHDSKFDHSELANH
jgi:hypothetical protein